MSIPQRARDLRKALDSAQFFTWYIPGRQGCVHQFKVTNPIKSKKQILVLVETSSYTLFGQGHNETHFIEISDTVDAIRKALDIE